MKVMIVSMRYDYGDPARGLSLSESYFEIPISKLVESVIFFDYMTIIKELGREKMNRDLIETVKRELPDVTIFVPFTDQFYPEIVDEINKYTITIGYYFDDVWRLEYSSFWARHFRYVTTSDINGIQRWKEAGHSNFIYSPFACNHEIFYKKALAKIYDVSFVGQYHPYRAWFLKKLYHAGIKVYTRGYGWPEGPIDIHEMVDVFNQSKINLNLSNNDAWDLRYVFSLNRPFKDTAKVFRQLIRLILAYTDIKTREMVKARTFEINACGSFQLSYYVEGLEHLFKIGEEISIYESVDMAIEKVRYYLKHESEREEIAQGGLQRSKKNHTLEQRYTKMFETIGVKI